MTPACTFIQLLGEGKQEKPCACPKGAVSDGKVSPGESRSAQPRLARRSVWVIQSGEGEGKNKGWGHKVKLRLCLSISSKVTMRSTVPHR